MAERQIQVGKMGQIYSEAYQVLVWLGHGEGSVRYALEKTVDFTSVLAWLWKAAMIAAKTGIEQKDEDLLQVLNEVNVSCEYIVC